MMIEPTNGYQVAVVSHDGAVHTHGCFYDRDEAEEWAMRHRDTLGLTRCRRWFVEVRGKGTVPPWETEEEMSRANEP
jgi:hypothetical protein